MEIYGVKISRRRSVTEMMSRLSLTAIIFSILFLSLTLFAAEQPVIESKGQKEYIIPENKMLEWKNIENNVLDEYKVCEEHCGKNSDCLNRCESVYRHRLETEHKKLMYE
jgi:hypothetical protein